MAREANTSLPLDLMAEAFAYGMETTRQQHDGEQTAKVFLGLCLEKDPNLETHDGTKLVVNALANTRKRLNGRA